MCDMPTLYSERNVRARKQHRCCECRISIKPGDTYHRAEGLWDGSFQTFKTCTTCAEFRDWLARLMPSDDCGVTFGDLYQCATDEWRDSRGKLSIGRKLVALRRRNRQAVAAHAADRAALREGDGHGL